MCPKPSIERPLGRKEMRMLTVASNSRPGSPLRLLALLATAHAALAFYLWFCAFDVNLVSTSVRLWQVVSGLWLVWPALPAVCAAASVARLCRDAMRPRPAFDAEVRAALRACPPAAG